MQLKKSSLEAEEKVVAVINRLLAKWRANPVSGGTNNSISAAGIQVIAKKLHAKRSFNSYAVFLDIGSGAGIPCIYMALKFGIRCIGIEKSPELVTIAKAYATLAGLSEDRCRFLCKDAATDLSSNFYVKHGVSHVMVFDACFGADALERLYRRLSRTKDFNLVGCSTARTRPYWQKHMKQLGGSTKSVKMCGRGASSFRFAVWKLV
jgi:SAM-dependent methyltransferase